MNFYVLMCIYVAVIFLLILARFLAISYVELIINSLMHFFQLRYGKIIWLLLHFVYAI